MTEKYLYWLEAAYLYYLHPEHGEIMDNYQWDRIGLELKNSGEIDEFGSLFQWKEKDYPESIRKKYENI